MYIVLLRSRSGKKSIFQIRTTSSNPSHIYADDYGEDPDCSSRNMNKISLLHGKCGMSTERTVSDQIDESLQAISFLGSFHTIAHVSG